MQQVLLVLNFSMQIHVNNKTYTSTWAGWSVETPQKMPKRSQM